jgi:hypothetical protein
MVPSGSGGPDDLLSALHPVDHRRGRFAGIGPLGRGLSPVGSVALRRRLRGVRAGHLGGIHSRRLGLAGELSGRECAGGAGGVTGEAGDQDVEPELEALGGVTGGERAGEGDQVGELVER